MRVRDTSMKITPAKVLDLVVVTIFQSSSSNFKAQSINFKDHLFFVKFKRPQLNLHRSTTLGKAHTNNHPRAGNKNLCQTETR